MPAELRLTTAHFDELRAHVLADENEHAAILVCSSSVIDGHRLLLCRDVVQLGDSDLESTSEQFHLDISPLALARVTKQAAIEGSTVVICHSHPFPGRVAASPIDLRTERDLCGRALPNRLERRPVGALILGPDGFDGRVWIDGVPKPLSLRVAGRSMRSAIDPLSDDDDRDARQLLVWGPTGQRRLREASVVIVGLGGTGSHVAMQLAHLGVGHLVLIDHDTLEASNLSRVIGARHDDLGRPKVDVLADAVARVRPDVRVTRMPVSVLEMDARQIATSDVIVCCTDGHGSRALLSELAAQYVMTLIDLGVEVQATRDATRAGGGIRVVRPGDACLHCMQVLDPALVREEFLTDAERAQEERRGYLRGAAHPEPSVVAINGVVASLAVVEILDELVGIFTGRPARILYRAEVRAVGTAGSLRDDACYVCGTEGILGIGDGRRLPRRQGEPRLQAR